MLVSSISSEQTTSPEASSVAAPVVTVDQAEQQYPLLCHVIAFLTLILLTIDSRNAIVPWSILIERFRACQIVS